MSVLSSEMFRMFTPASPTRLWDSLTRSAEPVPHFFGLTVRSEWRVMSTITAGPHDGPQLIGRVLRTDRPQKLTYSLGERIDEPSVYVTWELIPAQAGTIVRLNIDETEPSSEAELEAVWLPALQALQAHL
jgi:uncharacterized protein YndB with AHSA1/START domain